MTTHETTTDAHNALTAKSSQLRALLAITSQAPEALNALCDEDRAAFHWACHDLADEVHSAAVAISG